MYNYPAGCVQRPGWVLFTSRGQAGEPYAGGCRGNCSDRPARVSLCALCARLSCSLPSTSGKSARIHCRRQSIRALCKAVTWVADLSPLQAACAALRLSPCGAAGHSFLAGHAKHGATPQACSTGREAASPGLGAAPQQASGEIQQDIVAHCLPATYSSAFQYHDAAQF